MSAAIEHWLPLISTLVLGVVGIVALLLMPSYAGGSVSGGSETRRLQWVLGACGILGAAGHAFAKPGDPKKDQYPLFDLTTLTWFVLVVLAYYLPKIREVKFGDASFSLREEIAQARVDVESAVDTLADLLQSWVNAANIYLAVVRNQASPLRKTELLLSFLQDRMGEARTWLGDRPDSNVRIALWTYDPDKDELEFFWSNEIDDKPTIDATFKPGEGLLGRAFLERRYWNCADATKVQGFKPIGNRPPAYRGILCMPVYMYETNAVLGMLTVDKPEATEFSARAENVGLTLASLCALALDAVIVRPSTLPSVRGDVTPATGGAPTTAHNQPTGKSPQS